MINGNTQGIRQSILDEMDQMYAFDMETLRHQFIAPELMDSLAAFTQRINREISIYIARDGMVMDVTVGQLDRVELPDLRVKRGARRLTGIRCIHTHPEGTPELSVVDEKTLRRMHFDAIAAIGVRDGRPTGVGIAMLSDLRADGEYDVVFYGPFAPGGLPHNALLGDIEVYAERIGKMASGITGASKTTERAVLIALDVDGLGEESLEELERLVDTAGAEVIHKELQKRPKPDPATYLGSGKVTELALIRQALEVDLFVVNDELSGAQIRNLEQALGCKVIDRTTLILDIFARRATTHEGKLQVELAQYKYKLPRLMGMGGALSRLGGGIGTRGPGETKLESDRRVVRRRIHELETEVGKLDKNRATQRKQRERNRVPVVALVGYTNAGKSTLLNALSGSEVFAEDKLFATLDPVTRKIQLPEYGDALLTDTVGFIRKLPHDLVDAFRSTLEEAAHADVLLHVVDASSPDMAMQYRVAEEVLLSLGVGETPRIVAMNKIDRRLDQNLLDTDGAPCVEVSALMGTGLDALKEKMQGALQKPGNTCEYLVPYGQSQVLAWLHQKARVLDEQYEDDGVRVKVVLSAENKATVERMLGSVRPPAE